MKSFATFDKKGEPTPAGSKELVVTNEATNFAKLLDSMNVANRWLRGRRINWQTGECISYVPVWKTHCSLFVAAAALKLGVYILRPPEHKRKLLANAQCDWLRTNGDKQGWLKLKDSYQAQLVANYGCIVVATYKSTDPKRAGHIAIVRPTNKSEKDLKLEGAQITQAGRTNYVSTSTKEGFINHPGAFANNQINYYGHSTVFSKVEAVIERPLEKIPPISSNPFPLFRVINPNLQAKMHKHSINAAAEEHFWIFSLIR